MTNAAQKTPISLLQELCAQQGITPDYKLMSVEGAVHAPTFMYRVQVGEIIATATGQSKKKAKHAAAKAVLEKLLTEQGGYADGFVSDGVTVDASTLNEITAEPTQTVVQEENVQGNPVGSLQELCMKRRWQPPFYETEHESGLPHERVFTISCYVERFTEVGTGKSKRLAKRQAADSMLKRLQILKLADEDVPEEKESGMIIKEAKERVKDLKHSSLQSVYTQNVAQFLKELKTSTKSCLLALQDIDLTDNNLDCLKLLQSIGTEQSFDIMYIPIEEQGKSGDFHCLVQINSLPVAVCFGSGTTRDDAKSNSARNALNFIQIMSRK